MPDHPPAQPEPPAGTQPVTPAVRQRLQRCYEHGQRLMQQAEYDHDYAHSLLLECVTQDPGNHVYQDAFLENLEDKYNHNKRGAFLKFAGHGSFKRAVQRSDWAEVLRLGPELLKQNPWDVNTLRGLATACTVCSHFEAALRYLRNALEAKPQDADVNRHCAEVLARVGRFDDAIVCWQRVDEAVRGDAEAQQTIAELQVAKTEGRTSFRSRHAAEKTAPQGTKRREPPAAEPPPSPAKPTEEAGRPEIVLTKRQELEQALAINPTNADAYLALADLLVEEGRLQQAAQLLSKALGACGSNLSIQERLEDVQIQLKQQQLEIAVRRTTRESDEERQQLVEQLQDDLNRFELQVYDQRAQRYPEDLELKYQLAVRLKRCGNFRPALEAFEQARPLEDRAATATFESGECLQRLRQYEKAVERYEGAAELAGIAELPEIARLALYRIGLLTTGLGNLRAAEEAFSRLQQIAPDYKDVPDRLDKVREMRHKG